MESTGDHAASLHSSLAIWLRQEWPLLLAAGTTVTFLVLGKGWLADLSQASWFAFVLVWLFVAILLSATAVVRHAEHLAVKFGEPVGTLVLTLTVIGIEVMMISGVMTAGPGNEALARDAMFAVIMIVLNGMVGICLIAGALRYREQTYNLQGANTFLAVIVPLAVLGLILPNYTESSPGPTFSGLHSTFLILMSIGVYAIFLAIQMSIHRDYFVAPEVDARETTADHFHGEAGSIGYHVALLFAYIVTVVILAKKIAIPIDYGIHVLKAPPALGGFIVSVLVLSPESVAAVRAALANQLQRAVNLLFGSVLASISLTIPAALTIGFVLNQTIVLGLDGVDTVLLILTLGVSLSTFASSRTNVLQGAVHLLLFLAYIMMIFEK